MLDITPTGTHFKIAVGYTNDEKNIKIFPYVRRGSLPRYFWRDLFSDEKIGKLRYFLHISLFYIDLGSIGRGFYIILEVLGKYAYIDFPFGDQFYIDVSQTKCTVQREIA